MKIFFLFLCLFFGGCGSHTVSFKPITFFTGDKEIIYQKSPDDPLLFYTIRAKNLMELIRSDFPFAVRNLADPEYAVINEDWFCKDFASYLCLEVRKIGGLTSFDFFDCDDYSFLSKSIVACHYGRSSRHLKGATSIAFGVLYYIIDAPGTNRNGTSHAINAIVFVRDGKYKIKGYEPQTGEIIDFTFKERMSVTFVKF